MFQQSSAASNSGTSTISAPRPLMILLAALALMSLWLNWHGLEISNNAMSSSSSSVAGGDAPCLPASRPRNSNVNSSQQSIITTTTFSGTRNQTTATAPKLYHCGGYAVNRNFQPVLKSVLSEYSFVNLQDLLNQHSINNNNNNKKPPNSVEWPTTHPWDVFVTNYQLNECTSSHPTLVGSFHQWLQLSFEGKIVFWTPEDGTNFSPIVPKSNHYELGPGSFPSKNHHHHHRRLTITFLQAAFWAQLDNSQKPLILDPTKRTRRRQPQDNDQNFLIYAHSHCVGIRQQAFRQIANHMSSSTLGKVVHYGGKCHGGIKHNTSKALPYQNKVRLSNWEDNVDVYKHFRFCLTMEHVAARGYITEKILVAFWAGCLPIYWGTTEIFDVFNSNAFIFWNVSNPQPALDQLEYLERNRTAYDQVMKQRILAPGALEKYFSLDENYGGGILKAKLRTFLGLDEFSFAGSEP